MNTLKKRTGRIAVLVLTAALLVLPGLAAAATYYVSTAGDDTAGNGTLANPWRTIAKAAATVPAGTAGTPNVISVAAGTYNAGEAFPIEFTRNFVSLTGAGPANTIINAGTLNALDVDAKGFSVSGFTFQNASSAIDISEGGFTVANNIFDTNVGYGVYFYRSESDRTSSVSFANMSITGNTFETYSDGVYIYVYLDFDNTVEGLTAAFGNFTVSGNAFSVSGGNGIDISELFYPTDMVEGTVTAGNFTVTGNTFTDGYYGLYFYSEMSYLDNCQVNVGNTTVSNNTFTNQDGYGMHIDYWDVNYINSNYVGGSDVTLGNLTISGNTATSDSWGSYGIYLSDVGYIYDIYGDSTVTTGPISITNNTVNVEYYGLYLYFSYIEDLGEEYYDDTVSVTMGPTTITGNNITSRDYYGAYIEYYDISYYTFGQSAVALGPFTFSNNTVNAYYEALYYYVDYWGEYMYDDSSLVINAQTFANNTLTSTHDDAFYYYLYTSAYEMDNNASVDIKATTIANNTLTATGDGYGLYCYFDYIAYDMYGNATFAMAPVTVDNNTINSYYEGIYIEYSSYDVPAYMEDNTSATIPGWIITDNTIDVIGDYAGLYFYTYSNPNDNYDYATTNYGSMLIDNNTFNPDKNPGMEYGIYLYIEDLDEGHYGSGTTTLGNITITNNRLYALENEAIYLYFNDVGYYFEGAAKLTVGDIEIGKNIIDTAPYGIDAYFDNLYTNSRAKVTFGKVNIHDNTLTNISDSGIYAYYYNYNNDPDMGATLTIGAPTISGNTITGAAATGDGIYFYVDNSTEGITFGMPSIFGNTVSGFNQGIYLDNVEEASLSCNFLENNASVGIRFATDGTNFAVNTNSLVGNNVGLSVDNGYAAVINAENNWWGDKLGPAACASCNGVNPGDAGTVDFTPWLTYQPQQFRCGQAFPWILFVPATTGMGN